LLDPAASAMRRQTLLRTPKICSTRPFSNGSFWVRLPKTLPQFIACTSTFRLSRWNRSAATTTCAAIPFRNATLQRGNDSVHYSLAVKVLFARRVGLAAVRLGAFARRVANPANAIGPPVLPTGAVRTTSAASGAEPTRAYDYTK
jgi:hypothetical protein